MATVTTKARLDWKQVSAILVAIATLGAIHGYWIMPAILANCREQAHKDVEESMKEMHRRLEAHAATTHPGGVTQREFERLSTQLNRMNDSLDARLQRIESKL